MWTHNGTQDANWESSTSAQYGAPSSSHLPSYPSLVWFHHPPMASTSSAAASPDPPPSGPGPIRTHKSSRARQKDPAGPPPRTPRPPNAWILYRTDRLRELQAQLPPAPDPGPDAAPAEPASRRKKGKLSMAVASHTLGEMWKAESPAVRAEYERLANEKKTEHANAHPGYRYQPMKREEKERIRQERKEARKRLKTPAARRKAAHVPYKPAHLPGDPARPIFAPTGWYPYGATPPYSPHASPSPAPPGDPGATTQPQQSAYPHAVIAQQPLSRPFPRELLPAPPPTHVPAQGAGRGRGARRSTRRSTATPESSALSAHESSVCSPPSSGPLSPGSSSAHSPWPACATPASAARSMPMDALVPPGGWDALPDDDVARISALFVPDPAPPAQQDAHHPPPPPPPPVAADLPQQQMNPEPEIIFDMPPSFAWDDGTLDSTLFASTTWDIDAFDPDFFGGFAEPSGELTLTIPGASYHAQPASAAPPDAPQGPVQVPGAFAHEEAEGEARRRQNFANFLAHVDFAALPGGAEGLHGVAAFEGPAGGLFGVHEGDADPEGEDVDEEGRPGIMQYLDLDVAADADAGAQGFQQKMPEAQANGHGDACY